jgi:hypothetical protein
MRTSAHLAALGLDGGGRGAKATRHVYHGLLEADHQACRNDDREQRPFVDKEDDLSTQSEEEIRLPVAEGVWSARPHRSTGGEPTRTRSFLVQRSVDTPACYVLAAIRAFLVAAAFSAAALRLRVAHAFLPAARRLRVAAAFFATSDLFVAMQMPPRFVLDRRRPDWNEERQNTARLGQGLVKADDDTEHHASPAPKLYASTAYCRAHHLQRPCAGSPTWVFRWWRSRRPGFQDRS